MKIEIFLLKNLWVAIIFLTNSYVQCMEINQQSQLLSDAELHNQTQLVAYLPDEMLIHIFSYCDTRTQTLTELIKQCLKLKMICKRFNVILPILTISDLYKRYTIKSKDEALQGITSAIIPDNYHLNRLGVLILLHSGASPNAGMHMKYSTHVEVQSANYSLLHKAFIQEDTDLISLLLEYNVNPNQIHPNRSPLFFFAPTIAIADLFFKKGADLNAKDKEGNNVLWYVHSLSLEFINFYIKNGVDMRYINPADKTCILHTIVNPSFKDINNSNDFLKKGVLLIKKIPDMVNTLDARGKTPLDLMYVKMEREFYKNSPYYSKQFKQLITIYKAHGGKTAQELKEENELSIHHL